jgi:hypothetical protein
VKRLLIRAWGIAFRATNALCQMVLDGVAPVPREQDMPVNVIMYGMVVPGAAIHPVLPLEVTIQDLNPASASLGDWLTVSVLIRNTGKYPLEIPCSLNFASVFKPGNKDQRQLVVSASFVSAIGPLSMVAAGFAGSASVPGSMCSIPPQGTALVLGRMQARGYYAFEDLRLHNTTLDLRVKVAEWYYAENENKDEIMIINTSKDCVSVNSAPVFWHAPPPR